MKTLYRLFATSLVLASLFTANSLARAQDPLPPKGQATGLIYDGLEAVPGGPCDHLWKVSAHASPTGQCTHGPDTAPDYLDVNASAQPVMGESLTALSAAQCDGDGSSGNRTQVIYARASDRPDRFAQYLTSIQQWASDADAIFQSSAAETGGSRRIRFVHDAGCAPTVLSVVLSPQGDDTFGGTASELWYQGYNRTDRKYMVFVDANVYCGIGSIEYDDQPGAANRSNVGPHYARVDAGCWSGVIAAHELMHMLGGVQITAPNTDGGWHCYDGYDAMCDRAGHPVQYPCANPIGDMRFDCNHDDYFSTNVAPASYLATHWNSASNSFLIGAKVTSSNSVVTGRLRGNVFTATDTVNRGTSLAVRVHVVDQFGANLGGVSVTLSLTRPDGSAWCTRTAVSDAAGNAQASCKISNSAPTGPWNARVASLSLSGYTFNATGSIRDHNFTVQ